MTNIPPPAKKIFAGGGILFPPGPFTGQRYEKEAIPC